MTNEERFIQLSWELLEHKWRYYVRDAPIIQDVAYDALEKEYDALALSLGKPQSVSDMVGWKPDRWACRAVHEKMLRKGY